MDRSSGHSVRRLSTDSTSRPPLSQPINSSVQESKSSDLTVRAKQESAIVFITSESTGSEESRRVIRRRAAQHSHKVGRKPPRSKKKGLEDESIRGAIVSTKKKRVPTKHSIQGSISRSLSSSIEFSGESWSTSTEAGEEVDEEIIRASDETKVQDFTSHIRQSLLKKSLTSRNSVTTSSYPVPPQSWYPRLLDFMWQWMRQSWLAMEATEEERSHALSWVQYVTMTEPCYFFMNTLSVANALLDRGKIESWKVLWLTHQVVKSINEALNDSARIHSAGVVLAVGRIALAEIVTGDREVGERFHRPAHARLIAMAGGLDALGLPSLVHKHVCWADRVLTMITNKSISEIEAGIHLDPEPPFGPQAANNDLELLDQYRPARKRKHGNI